MNVDHHDLLESNQKVIGNVIKLNNYHTTTTIDYFDNLTLVVHVDVSQNQQDQHLIIVDS